MKVVFVTNSSNHKINENVIYLISSIRTFGASFSKYPIWIMVPSPESELDPKFREFLDQYNVQLFPYDQSPKFNQLPLTQLIDASATAEGLAVNNFSLLIWLDSNSLILQEPNAFILQNENALGYRPVHHTLIGSLFDDPAEVFWKLLFTTFELSEENFFPMKTHVDGNIIRPYFNAGCLVVRPKQGIFTQWQKKFSEFAFNKELSFFYNQNSIYKIFIHQAILSCVILRQIPKNQLQELPFEYNYPLHLYNDSLDQFRPKDLNDLITIRYENKADLEFLLSRSNNDLLKNWFTNLRKELKNKFN